MQADAPRVLLIVEQCNPAQSSVPLEGFRYYTALSRVARITLVTHARNREAMDRAGFHRDITFIPEGAAMTRYARAAEALSKWRGRINWPLRHALFWPVYAEFNRRVFRAFRDAVERGEFDVVHAFTPILPRYPVKMVEARGRTPFVLGPVNGGLAFPGGFPEIARREFSRFYFLRSFVRFIPGYRRTYRRATRVLAGSRETLGMLRKMMPDRGGRIVLLHENGVQSEFLAASRERHAGDAMRLIFVGRLVPYKCADVVIEAMSRLPDEIRGKTRLVVVGEGPERARLVRLARDAGLAAQVSFTGWVPQEQTFAYYSQSDIFCFPSVREFGGAVVLEAMAAGLPCIVADYGGIAEYVTEGTGIRIPLRSRDELVQGVAASIEKLAGDPSMLRALSAGAAARAREFTWENKALRILEIYRDVAGTAAAREVTAAPIAPGPPIVVIGRNEAARLERSIASALRQSSLVVYVDSGSHDGSADLARSLGAHVIEVDAAFPFTAARARNAGARFLAGQGRETEAVQFIDGDCELAGGWLERAWGEMKIRPEVAAVCGRRRERFRCANIYTRLLDLEWDAPPGEADSFGGDVLIRLSEFREAGGYNEQLIAGEDPELSLRLRRKGGRILCLDTEMTLHESNMTHFAEWWRRAVRAGHAFGEVAWLHGAGPEHFWVRENASIVFWALCLPIVLVAVAFLSMRAALLIPAAYGALFVRIWLRGRSAGRRVDAALYAASCIAAKFPQACGILWLMARHCTGRAGRIVGYKTT